VDGLIWLKLAAKIPRRWMLLWAMYTAWWSRCWEIKISCQILVPGSQ